MWFAHALVYHARGTPEQKPLAEFIRATVRRAEHAEVRIMGKTIAEALMEEGEVKGALAKQRETLLRLLRLKFKRVSPAIAAEVGAAEDGRQLDEWLDAVITAEKITDIPFQAGKKK